MVSQLNHYGFCMNIWFNKNKERVRQIIELIAIVAGISGLTISNLSRQSPIIFYSLLLFLFAISIITFIAWKDENNFTSKKEIDEVWQDLITGATDSILVFAGDVSWAERDKNTIYSLTQRNIMFSVLCRRPRTNELLKNNIRVLINAGAHLRYYDEADSPKVRGIVIDNTSSQTGTALITSKTAKVQYTRKYGVPGNEKLYDYHATRYVPPSDNEQIKVLSQLFDKMWQMSMQGFVLYPIDLSIKHITDLLKTVPHYLDLVDSSVTFEKLDINSLWATCDIVKSYKFPNISSLLDAYNTQNIKFFEPSLCFSHERRSILLPPIIERHPGKLVVIDGMHRLYSHLIIDQQADALCIVISIDLELPSRPIPFSQVRVQPRKLPRNQSFKGFKPEMFRNIDILEDQLEKQFNRNSP